MSMPNQYTNKTQQQTYEGTEFNPQKDATCCHYPEFKRLKYFYGQMLGQNDFQTEQDYFREKLRLHNRCLHGYGTVCGLEVRAVPVARDCGHPSHEKREQIKAALAAIEKKLKAYVSAGGKNDAESEKVVAELRAEAESLRRDLDNLPNDHACDPETPTLVRLECGLALDCSGNELIVRQPLDVDLWHSLSADERKHVNVDGQTLYVSICYCEMPVDPVRPVLTDTCGGSPECVYGKLADAIRVKVTTKQPDADERCETCCTACGDPCLLLAEIHDFRKGEPLTFEQIDNSVRRMVGPYSPTTITGISWTHGAEYTSDETAEILGTDGNGGIEVMFSRPVLTETLTRGVVDIWVLTGGHGDSGAVTHQAGEFVDLPKETLTRSFRFRQVTGETLQNGDRVLIIIRTSFILDKCCHAVDGDHIGGRVPILPDHADKKRDNGNHGCTSPPQRTVPWTSGNGSCGGTFESWFYVKRTDGNRGTGRYRETGEKEY